MFVFYSGHLLSSTCQLFMESTVHVCLVICVLPLANSTGNSLSNGKIRSTKLPNCIRKSPSNLGKFLWAIFNFSLSHLVLLSKSGMAGLACDLSSLGYMSSRSIIRKWSGLDMTTSPCAEYLKIKFCKTNALHAGWLWSTCKYATLNGCMSQTDCFKILCYSLFLSGTVVKNCTNMFCTFRSCVAWQPFCW